MNYVTITEEMRDYYEACSKELQAYRTGGITQEILRRKDGTLKLGKDCMIISQKTYDELIAINVQLRSEIDDLEGRCKHRDIADFLVPKAEQTAGGHIPY